MIDVPDAVRSDLRAVLIVGPESSEAPVADFAAAILPWPVIRAVDRVAAASTLAGGVLLAAVLVDLELGESGQAALAMVELARRELPNTRCAVVVGEVVGGALLNQLSRVGADVISRIGLAEALCQYARLVSASLLTRESALRRSVEAVGVRYKLTPRELDVVSLVAVDVPRRLLPERLGIAAPTLKCHVRAILSKMDLDRIDDVGKLVRRLAV